MADDLSTQRIQSLSAVDKSQAQKAQQASSASKYAIIQEAKAEDFQEWSETLNPVAVATRRFETLEIKVKKKPREEETEKAEKVETEEISIEGLEEISEQYEEKNPELHSKNLLLLRSRIKKGDNADDVYNKVLDAYPDPSLADEALDFLIATSDGDLQKSIKESKGRLEERYGREIKAGKNISVKAREFSDVGLGSPTGLRDLYREITGNPREPLTLFEELCTKYPFDKMQTTIAFLLHSLGADLRSKGPSIPRGELHRLVTETRSLQAILGVYRFFASRMNLILSSFDREGLAQNQRVTFQMLAKLFVKFLLERYPSAEKVFQMGVQLGLSDEIIAEIIIYSQMRDAVRQVAPRLYRNEQHKQDILKTILEALDTLEDKLEELAEEEEGEDE